MSANGSVDALARVLAQGIAEAAREIAREEGRRAALEVLDKAGGAPAQEWVTQAAAARRAGVTPQTVREWLRAGDLGEPGRRGAVNVERLRAFLAGNAGATAPAGRGRQIAAAALAAGGGRR